MKQHIGLYRIGFSDFIRGIDFRIRKKFHFILHGIYLCPGYIPHFVHTHDMIKMSVRQQNRLNGQSFFAESGE